MTGNLPNRIKTLREQRGWGLRDLAAHCGMQHSKVQRLETGQTPLDYNDMRKIAGAFGVRISALLNDKDVETRADQFGDDVLDLLATVPDAERAHVLTAAIRVAGIARSMAAGKSAAALGGGRELVEQLVEIWNNFSDEERHEALKLWRSATRLRDMRQP